MKHRILFRFLIAVAFAGIPVQHLQAAEPEETRKDTLYVTHPWYGVRVAYLGDSITDPGTLGETPIYWNYLQEWLDITPLVYGKGGHQWHQLLGQAARLTKEHGDSFDAIIIFLGTNDFNAGVPIGEWFSEETVQVNADGKMVERVRRTPVFDLSTFRGRINFALDSLKRTYPSKQIVLLTPVHRAFAQFSDYNIQPDESYQNSCGEYIDAYIESIKEASSLWSVPVIDLYSLSGLFPMHKEQAEFFPGGNDWLHPDTDGHRRIAECLYYQLLTLPCRFTR